ncbi:hypothetical protein E4U35_000380 [Claviceps purpurea]|nr:hypothetical protein E4U35_000380 [Claviceps purpurea]
MARKISTTFGSQQSCRVVVDTPSTGFLPHKATTTLLNSPVFSTLIHIQPGILQHRGWKPDPSRFQQSSGSNSHQVPTVIRFQQSPYINYQSLQASLMDTDDPHMSTIITTQQGAIQPFIMHEGPKVLTEQPDTTSIIILFDRAPGQGPKALTEHPARTSQFHESTEE